MTTNELKQIATSATDSNILLYAPILDKYMKMYSINGKMREAAFIAQILHESGSFKYTKEIASGQAYEGRKDLGNTQQGDGVRFKGRGLIQITGRHNYEAMSKALGIDFVSKPELVEQPEYAAWTACRWWWEKGLSRLSDAGKFIEITKIINGGTNGLADRQKWYNNALNVLK
jgi:putative chitinase